MYPDIEYAHRFYQLVHRPGITIIGAHTNARPSSKSYPHYWTERDDCIAILNFMQHGRLDMYKLISEVHSPEEALEVYRRLAVNKDFSGRSCIRLEEIIVWNIIYQKNCIIRYR